jgi:hypothetical protein
VPRFGHLFADIDFLIDNSGIPKRFPQILRGTRSGDRPDPHASLNDPVMPVPLREVRASDQRHQRNKPKKKPHF